MDASTITTPQQLGKVLKDIFKKRGIDIRTRYIKTVRGLEGSWYEVTTFHSQHIIPNDIRQRSVELNYEKPLAECNISNVDNVNYGNTNSQKIAMHGRKWKQWIKEQSN